MQQGIISAQVMAACLGRGELLNGQKIDPKEIKWEKEKTKAAVISAVFVENNDLLGPISQAVYFGQKPESERSWFEQKGRFILLMEEVTLHPDTVVIMPIVNGHISTGAVAVNEPEKQQEEELDISQGFAESASEESPPKDPNKWALWLIRRLLSQKVETACCSSDLCAIECAYDLAERCTALYQRPNLSVNDVLRTLDVKALPDFPGTLRNFVLALNEVVRTLRLQY